MTITLYDQQLSELESVLARQTETYQLVAQAMGEKCRVLVEGDYQGLMAIDQNLGRLGQETLTLESQRLQLMESAGLKNATLGGLITQIRSQEVQTENNYPVARLEDARRQLNQVIQDVQALNVNNQKLLNLSLHWIEDTVKVITNAVRPEGASYNATGAKLKSKNPYTTMPQSTFVRDI